MLVLKEMTSESQTLLADSQVAAAARLCVFDARGNKIRFGALFELETTLIVFIRKFHLFAALW